MKALVWHWGRRGAGPLFAAQLANALRETPGWTTRLSLAAGAELLAAPDAPLCDWPEPTYGSGVGFIGQRLAGPFLAGRTRRRLAQQEPDIAICAMPALLDSRMLAALAATRTDYAVVVHDAQAHPGEALNFHALGQRRLLRGARCLFTLTQHVEDALRRQHFGQHGQILAKLWHPPVGVAVAPRPQRDSARPRLLYFGRLLAYKGLDLLADALAILGPDLPFDVRICGDGPDSQSLSRLRALPGVTVERRWVADRDVPELLAWADALVLPYREASQSGVAAMAVAAGRHVLATRVGGLPEQLDGLAHALLCAPAAADIAHGLLELAARWRAAPEVAPLDATAGWRAMACEMASILGTLPPLDAESTSPAPRRRRAVREDSAFRKA